jgi:hypothetical protein
MVKVKFCPKCGSTNIKFLANANGFPGFHCSNCNETYPGQAPEKELDIKDNKEKKK